jgi:hypothetical protein
MTTKQTFMDFSTRLLPPWEWICQAIMHDDVLVFWHTEQRAWCRKIDNVECIEIDGWYVPVAGQLIEYAQAIPNRH